MPSEAEASAKGTPHEYTLNPEVFKRDTLPVSSLSMTTDSS